MTRADGEHNFNDVVVAPDGAVYITDSTQGAVYRIDPRHGGALVAVQNYLGLA